MVFFKDLELGLQKTLRDQLQKRGDVSDVIEVPGRFLFFIAKEVRSDLLGGAVLSIPKTGYDEWLAQQPPEGQDNADQALSMKGRHKTTQLFLNIHRMVHGPGYFRPHRFPQTFSQPVQRDFDGSFAQAEGSGQIPVGF